MAPEEMTIGELGRKLDDIHEEMKSLKTTMLPRTEWELHRNIVGGRIGEVEKTANRVEGQISTIARVAWTGIILPIATAIIAALLFASLGLK